MKRNYINEIAQIKERNGLASKFGLRVRLLQLKTQFENLLKVNDSKLNKLELAKYFPIALVASAELYFRSISQSLIDAGEPYSKNAGKFNQTNSIKFDFEIVNAIHGRSISVGEIISHMLPFNNLVDIDSNISIIIGKDFISEIKKFKKHTKLIEDYNQAVDDFNKHHHQILTDVSKLYEIRHIACHEFGTALLTDLNEIYRVFCNSIIFFVTCDWYLNNELYPNSPETSADMIKHAIEVFETSEKQLEKVITSIRNSKYSSNNEIFEGLILKWKEFRELSSDYYSSLYEFGTLQPLLKITEKGKLTDEFRNNLMQHPIFLESNK